MKAGTHLIALLWESAWVAGDGDSKITGTTKLSPDDAMAIVARPDFLPSFTIDKIASKLRG